MFQSAPRSRDRGDWVTGGFSFRERPGFNPRPGHVTGATTGFFLWKHTFMFQSAPRSRDRGDVLFAGLGRIRQPFQSAPRSRDRGDSNRNGYSKPVVLFQSAPRSRDRGDRLGSWQCYAVCSSFNPRPGHVTGATRIMAKMDDCQHCFNPRPGHVTGATPLA